MTRFLIVQGKLNETFKLIIMLILSVVFSINDWETYVRLILFLSDISYDIIKV